MAALPPPPRELLEGSVRGDGDQSSAADARHADRAETIRLPLARATAPHREDRRTDVRGQWNFCTYVTVTRSRNGFFEYFGLLLRPLSPPPPHPLLRCADDEMRCTIIIIIILILMDTPPRGVCCRTRCGATIYRYVIRVGTDSRARPHSIPPIGTYPGTRPSRGTD